MTDLKALLAETLEICEEATPGPWVNGYTNAGEVTPMPDHVWAFKTLVAKDLAANDAELIAHSRTALPKLAKALRVAVDALQKMDGHWFDSHKEKYAYACVVCDVGGSGRQTNGDGHDFDCTVSELHKALSDIAAILEAGEK